MSLITVFSRKQAHGLISEYLRYIPVKIPSSKKAKKISV
jgi:hypothetical protein